MEKKEERNERKMEVSKVQKFLTKEK